MTQPAQSTEYGSTQSIQPLPDISEWSNGFRGWSILNKVLNPNASTGKLGILIAESSIAENRIFGWATLFVLLAMVFGFIATRDSSNRLLWVGIAFVFLAAALYRFMTWYLNRDLKVELFRGGLTFRKAGQTQIVHWHEVEHVKEQWEKTVYQGIIHIYSHKVEIHKNDGTMLLLDRSFEKIEQIGRLIQFAVADSLLPAKIEQLKNDAECDFGVFAISRLGIRHKDKNFLPWTQVRAIEVFSIGRTTLKVQAVDHSKWASAWATENGGTVKNLHLFLSLSYWFINAAHQPTSNVVNSSLATQRIDNGDVHYRMLITKAEARNGMQKMLYAGTSMQERELTVKIPPGVQPGTIYRFPGYGRSPTEGSSAGTLNVEIFIEQITPLQKRLQEIQMFLGIIILMGGLIWLGFWSSLDLITNIILAILIGGLGGFLMSTQQRFVGLVSGAIGGALSFVIQFAYYVLMYIFFGRESFWNYESVLVLGISILPGFGIYKLLQKWVGKQVTQP